MLSKKNRYAFQALEYLLEHRENGPQIIVEIATARKIPRKFLEVILLDLKRAGILGSLKGKGGGYYILKSIEDIRFADVIRAIDGPIALLPCASLNYHEKCSECPHEEASCKMRALMVDVRNETLKILEGRNLGELLK
jgi:Rrf2 family protein